MWRTPWRLCFLAGALHALLFTLSFPPYDLWPLTYVSIVPLALLALRTRSLGRAALATWLMSAIAYAWMERWLIEVTWQGYPLLAMYMAAYPATFVWLLGRLRPRNRPPLVPALTNTLLVPLLWVGLEAIRGTMLGEGAYPWFFVGHPLIAAPVLCQTSDLLGSYAVSFLAAMPAGLVADFLTLPVLRDRKLAPTLRLSLIAFAALHLAALLYGIVRVYDTDEVTADQPELTVAALQTNVPQSNKMTGTFEERVRDFEHFLGLSRSAVTATRELTGEAPDLIIWPETMAPGYGLNDEATAELDRVERETGRGFVLRTRRSLSELASSLSTPLLVGAHAEPNLAFALEDGEIAHVDSPGQHNSAYLFLPDGELSAARYDKVVLTPFGEIMPYVNRWPRVQQWLLDFGAHGMTFDLAAGEEYVRIELPSAPDEDPLSVATPICFESTTPALCRRLIWNDEGVKSAHALINLTNDGWFTDSLGGRARHVMVGRFRCIENRVPLVRAANTGISAAFDSAGRVIQVGPNFPPGLDDWKTEGLMIATIRSDPRRTLYGRIGDSFAWICFGLTVVLTLASFMPRRVSHEDPEES